MRRLPLAHAAALVASLIAADARAQSKEECLDAFETAQHLRASGKLIEARDRLQVCGGAQCPALVRDDCAAWESEVLTAIPTVTLAARDGAGSDLLDVTVSVDGVRLTERLDGRAVPLDPGVHTLRFESPGRVAQEQTLVVRAGEKNRAVSATLAADASGPGSMPSSPRPGEPAMTRRPIPWPVPVLAGVGVASLAAAAILYFPVVTQAHELRASCAPGCSQETVDSLTLRRDASWVLASAGGAALAGAAVVLFFRPTFVVLPSTSGAILQVAGRF
ncbi:MAG TPA: hypothetical protein VIJ22_04645 [Polyangiaceae bacterium]